MPTTYEIHVTYDDDHKLTDVRLYGGPWTGSSTYDTGDAEVNGDLSLLIRHVVYDIEETEGI